MIIGVKHRIDDFTLSPLLTFGTHRTPTYPVPPMRPQRIAGIGTASCLIPLRRRLIPLAAGSRRSWSDVEGHGPTEM